ncbi:MAG: PilT/PilU family type 4a pilus ATPase [Patescibacteria group bacterium]|nr:PilT/PilU family type 4a pilus ATPase [Patescibacteria group bacterium]
MDYKELLNNLIKTIIEEGGSDLHLSVGYNPAIRVHGNLFFLKKINVLTSEDVLGVINELLDKEYNARFEREKEVDFSYGTEKIRFRGNCFYSQGTPGVSLRVISKKIKTLEELNLPPVLETFTQKEQGFFLVVGPVGNGKTTTLATMLDIINQNKPDHIVTIEDPIEYVFSKGKSVIDQREIETDTKDFSTALKSVFRQDADVLMIGEMRGIETIATSVTAAETGHLVFSTLHTNDAAQTIDRIIDVFPAGQQTQIRTQLAGSLLGIFSQRLVPRTSGGVIPAYELLIKNTAVANLIREGRTYEIPNVIETGAKEGMISLDKSLSDLVRIGEITLDDAKRYSLQVDHLDRMLN